MCVMWGWAGGQRSLRFSGCGDDIKPANLMWTSKAVKIVDFNVSIRAGDLAARGGGTLKYIPPDLDRRAEQTDSDRADRDIYALGITLYQAVTGEYLLLVDKTP